MIDKSELNIESILGLDIYEEFARRVTGTDNKEFYFYDEVNQILVGILEPVTSNSGFDNIEHDEKRNISSIGINLSIKKSVSEVKLNLMGSLFYKVIPTYEEEVKHYLTQMSERFQYEFISIEQVRMHADKNPALKDFRGKCLQKYKKIELLNIIPTITLDLKNKSESFKEDLLVPFINTINSNIERLSKDSVYYNIKDISFDNLKSEEGYLNFINLNTKYYLPKWEFTLDFRGTKHNDRDEIFLTLINKTVLQSTLNEHIIFSLYDAKIKICFNNLNDIFDVKTEFSKENYKKSKPIKAIANNCSYEENNFEQSICTTNIPTYHQYRLVTKKEMEKYITFESLINNPIDNLEFIVKEMNNDLTRLKERYKKNIVLNNLSELEINQYNSDLQKYQFEIKRFSNGVELIKKKNRIKKSFILMNKTFSINLNQSSKTYSGWRLFQLVFIVSQICDITKNEYLNDGDFQYDSVDDQIADLLYFPTGGGKTESFLGCIIFSLFFDRYRNKNYGVNSIIKYPLRLLSIQQLERTLQLLTKANVVKSKSEDLSDTNDFSLGYFVGEGNTPNKIDEVYANTLKSKIQSDIDDMFRLIEKCPMCGEPHVHVKFNEEKWVLEHICTNSECSLNSIPLYIVDNEIYRILPEVIVSTMDKIANIGINSNFKNLFGMVNKKCPKHGYFSKQKCEVPNCTEISRDAYDDFYDPLPSMIIQDELHLVRESLGTFASHYETFIQNYCKNLTTLKHRRKIKYIGATATISNYERHIYELYALNARRFPAVYPHELDNEDFYSKTLIEKDISRIILGFAPRNISVTDTVQAAVNILRRVVYDKLMNLEKEIIKYNKFNIEKEDLLKLLMNYWISIVYTNSKDDSIKINNLVQNQGNNLLRKLKIPEFIIEQINGDISFQDIKKILTEIENSHDKYQSTNLLISTSTISHGVDEDEFNQIIFFGIPNNTAEYIQAYSRVGRKYTGIVIDVIRLLKERDKSYLRNFNMYHQNKDILIDPVPINRWAKNAIYSTFPGLLSGILLQYYEPKIGKSMFFAMNFKNAIKNDDIKINEVKDILYESYCCKNSDTISLLYKEIINEETDKIFESILNDVTISSDDRTEIIFNKYTSKGKLPMKSLRDIEKGLLITTR